MSTLSEAAERLMKSLTPRELEVLELRRQSWNRMPITIKPRSTQPAVKRGRGQRRNRRNRAGRVKHEAHRWVALLLRRTR